MLQTSSWPWNFITDFLNMNSEIQISIKWVWVLSMELLIAIFAFFLTTNKFVSSVNIIIFPKSVQLVELLFELVDFGIVAKIESNEPSNERVFDLPWVSSRKTTIPLFWRLLQECFTKTKDVTKLFSSVMRWSNDNSVLCVFFFVKYADNSRKLGNARTP